MSKVVCNIPHASTVIPKWAMKDIVICQEEFSLLIDFMTDTRVDELWSFVPESHKQVASVSRLIVDTERFRNDADETMALKGMGLYYTHTPDGKPFRNRTKNSYEKCLAIYDDYHLGLEEKVTSCLKIFGKCIVLDCHSFHDEMNYTGFPPSSFPDVCIGVNEKISSEAEIVLEAFKKNGYTVKVNEPFSGSLVPLKYINDNQVVSIMIELNRRIYNNTHFSAVQNICREIYAKLK